MIASLSRLTLIVAVCVAAFGLGLIGYAYPGVALALLAFAWWRKFHRRPVSDAYGSARTSTMADMARGGLLSEEKDALILGRTLPEPTKLAEGIGSLFNPAISNSTAVRSFLASTWSDRWQSERLIRTNNYVHLATFSPAGGGKGVAAVIPNLLAYPGNCVIVDVKGELWETCSEHRRRRFGKRQIRLDPFEACGPGGDRFNYLDVLPDAADPTFLDRCKAFAAPLIIREKDEKQPHFNDWAEKFLYIFTAFVAACQPDRKRRHLGTVRHLASSKDIFDQAIDMMRKTDAAGGVIRMTAGQLTFPAAEEMGSILSTFTRQTDFLDSPAVAANVASSTFDPMELKTGDADLYLILPAEFLVSHVRLMRLWINGVMGRVTSGKPDESRKLLWMLDEFAHIGRMDAIENAVTLYRGYGMRLWFFFQDMNQIKDCFGSKASTIVGNIGTLQYFSINNLDTAKEISERAGDMTLGQVSTSEGGGTSHSGGPKSDSSSRSTSWNVNRTEIARRLLKPEEILTLDKNLCLIFHHNLPVALGRLVKYFEAPEFRKGGTAAPKKLGPAAAMLAALTLLLSLFVADAAVFAVSMRARLRPAGAASRMRQAGPASPSAGSHRPPSAAGARQAPHARPPMRRYPPRRRPGPSGFLIKISNRGA